MNAGTLGPELEEQKGKVNVMRDFIDLRNGVCSRRDAWLVVGPSVTALQSVACKERPLNFFPAFGVENRHYGDGISLGKSQVKGRVSMRAPLVRETAWADAIFLAEALVNRSILKCKCLLLHQITFMERASAKLCVIAALCAAIVSCKSFFQTRPISHEAFTIGADSTMEIVTRPNRHGFDTETMAIYSQAGSKSLECQIPAPPRRRNDSCNFIITSRTNDLKMVLLDSGRNGIVVIGKNRIDCVGDDAMRKEAVERRIMPLVSKAFLNRVRCRTLDCVTNVWFKGGCPRSIELDDLR